MHLHSCCSSEGVSSEWCDGASSQRIWLSTARRLVIAWFKFDKISKKKSLPRLCTPTQTEHRDCFCCPGVTAATELLKIRHKLPHCLQKFQANKPTTIGLGSFSHHLKQNHHSTRIHALMFKKFCVSFLWICLWALWKHMYVNVCACTCGQDGWVERLGGCLCVCASGCGEKGKSERERESEKETERERERRERERNREREREREREERERERDRQTDRETDRQRKGGSYRKPRDIQTPAHIALQVRILSTDIWD